MRRVIWSAIVVGGLALFLSGANGVSGGSPEDSDAATKSKLEQEYVELVKEQAALMEREHLQARIEMTKKEIEQLKADKLLRSAMEQLDELIEKYPKTYAAQTARDASQLIQSRPMVVRELGMDETGKPRTIHRIVPSVPGAIATPNYPTTNR